MFVKKILFITDSQKQESAFRAVFSLIPEWCTPRYSLDVVTHDVFTRIVSPACSCIILGEYPKEICTAFLEEYGQRFPVLLLLPELDSPHIQQLYALGVQDVLEEGRFDSIQLHRAIGAAMQRKVYSEYRVQAASLAQLSDQVKSIFMGLMSHELRTPLNGITLAAELLEMSTLDQEQQELLRTITVSAMHLAKMIAEVLDFNLLDNGNSKILHERFSVTERLRIVEERFRSLSAQKQQTLTVALDADMPDCFVGDPKKLEHILVNLLSNAIRHTATGGEVSLEVRMLQSHEQECLLQFSVLDTGEGIDTIRQEQIFHLFSYQPDRSLGQESTGLGLGLPVAYRLVSLLGGNIWVDSAPGEGSCFHFTCPLRMIEHRNNGYHQSASLSDSSLTGKQILLVEHSLAHQRIALNLLRRWGCTVRVASDHQSLTRALERASFDAVIVSMTSPEKKDISNLDVLKVCEEIVLTPQKPVYIATSSAITEHELIRYQAVGFHDCLGKPYRGEELFQTLKRHLCSH